MADVDEPLSGAKYKQWAGGAAVFTIGPCRVGGKHNGERVKA